MTELELWKKRLPERESKELDRLSDEQLKERFSAPLTFGTGGIRAKMGLGTSMLNKYTVGRIAQGLALMLGGNHAPVAIARDSRNNSTEFAVICAEVLAAAGIPSYFFDDVTPTPLLSYTVREYGCSHGIMITASHNSAEYNGCKIYDGRGCQLLPEASLKLGKIIDSINVFDVNRLDFDLAVDCGLVTRINDNVMNAYIGAVKGGNLGGLNIAYTPLCGSGYKIVPQLINECGGKVFTVPTQSQPNGDFPTCPLPNPENFSAMSEVIALARTHNCSLALANDPDADRLGVAVKCNSDYVILSGNDIGVLMTDYILRNALASGRINAKTRLIRSIVSTPLVDKLAENYGVEVIETLTGFKYIGDIINSGKFDVIFGFEESNGYLTHKNAADKDGVAAALLICRMAAELALRGQSLMDRLIAIYSRYGVYTYKRLTYEYDGDFSAKVNSKMKALRSLRLGEIGGSKVVRYEDFAIGVGGKKKADVLRYTLACGSIVVVRPSGTEPIIKVYITATKSSSENKSAISAISMHLDRLLTH